MKIIYVSSTCSNKTFDKILDRSKRKVGFQGQKFHHLLMEGLSRCGVTVEAISSLPVSRQNTRGLIFSFRQENISKKLIFNNLFFINFPIIRHVCLFLGTFVKIFQSIIKNGRGNTLIVCDVLTLSVSISAFFASRILKIPTMAIVMDLPQFLPYFERKETVFRNISVLISNFFMTRHDSYLLMTQKMNKIANPKDKPYIIIEGLSDAKMIALPVTRIDPNKKILLYAGSLHRSLGVSALLESFSYLENKDFEFWFCGSGELEEDIKAESKFDPRIKFLGLVSNQELIERQMKATLLLNPRPIDSEFAAYSFPSKIMEYMATGTPVVSTNLEAIPNSYKDKIYFFKSLKPKDMARCLTDCLNLPTSQRKAIGKKARHYIIQEKNNIVQSQKIIEFISKQFSLPNA